ncbi:MAG: site-specific integrase [Burkholderiaceae bacterium]|nr:site-specific integrase [Burkholderiaceae bacterium]
MAASRRALPTDATSAWIQRLRLYILTRALDALDELIARERHLAIVCGVLRRACETTGAAEHGWIANLVGDATGYFEFQAETTMKCRVALGQSVVQTGHAFFQALLSVLEGRKWIPAPGKHPTAVSAPPTPYARAPGSQDWRALLASFDTQPPGKAVNFGDVGGNSISIATQETNADDSQAKRMRLGDGLRLEGVEQSLFLRHSWHQLTAIEENCLLERIKALLQADSLDDRFGAAVTFLAVLSSQSMHDVGKMSLVPAPNSDWRLDLKSARLMRDPPRFARRWRSKTADMDASPWLHPLSQQWRFELDAVLCKPLRAALSTAPDAATLADLWEKVGSVQTLATWFNTRFADQQGLLRLSAPSVANPLAMQVFQNSSDQALAQLIASDSRTALPAACAYGSYRAPDVHRALGSYVKPGLANLIAPLVDVDLNCCGSELDPRMPLLNKAIKALVKRVDAAALTSSWVEHHNLLTALTALALLASTGARPVNSPFESAAWIDFERSMLYVEDKSAGPTQGSRVCVLSDYARDLLQIHYLPHLEHLADALRSNAPDFAAELSKVLAGDPEAGLPLMLFIRSEPAFDWIEVSESQLDIVCQFGWPLPWNLFRHLNSTLLRRWGLHPEIRDALLGHADQDAETHGDFSARVPADDLEVARPLINRLQQELGFALPAPNPGPGIAATLKADKLINPLERRFGRQARSERRATTLASARDLAKHEIEIELGGRDVDQLSSDELDRISRKMLLRVDGLPHVMGSVRYEVFEEWLATQWRSRGKHAKMRRRYLLAPEGRQVFTEDVVLAGRRLEQFSAAFESLLSARPRRAERPVMAAAVASIDLILNSKLAHFPALCALLCNHQSIQLVRLDGRYWFEWAYGAKWQDGKPVFRVEVSERAAHWISLARAGKSSTKVPALPLALASLPGALHDGKSDLAGMVKQLIKLRAQTNALHLPGIYASYLNARRPSAALPHSDWIRVTSGSAPLSPQGSMLAALPAGSDADDEAESFFRSHHRPPAKVEGTARQRCKLLFDAIEKSLRSSNSNRQIAAAIARAVKASGFGPGDAPYLLAHFATHLLTRKPKKGSRERLRASTAQRYWYSLAPPFADTSAEANLIDMEEDELTDLYTEVVASWVSGSPAGAPSAGDQDPSDKSAHGGRLAGVSDAPLRTLQQLREFHDFVRATYGLLDPNWTEISPDITVGVGRPGLLLLNEYLAVLAMQLGDQAANDVAPDVLSKAFVLIACARFGLRIGEAVGLNRGDWLDSAGALTVLVRSNSTRPLKTTSSRRQVPLVETLTPVELDVIEQVILNWVHREGMNGDRPLLPGVSHESFKFVKNSIGGALLAEIKMVTRHEGSTVHMLRHGYSMRVLSRLLAVELDPGASPTTTLVEASRRLLLGHNQTDRRTLWAVARLLGHASPSTTLRSYVNCLYLWLPPVLGKPSKESDLTPPRTVNLDALARDGNYLSGRLVGAAPRATSREPLFLRHLRFLRLLVIGQTEIKAAENAKLSNREAQTLGAAMAKTSARLAMEEKRYGAYKLLGGLSTTRMSHLVELAGTASLPAHVAELSNWDDTIGSSRQILLFDQTQLNHLADFLLALDLTKNDVWLVMGSRAHAGLEKLIESAGLRDYLHAKNEVAQTFQLDVVRFDRPPWGAAQRVAVIAREKGKLRSSFELLLLWTLWNTAHTAEI